MANGTLKKEQVKKDITYRILSGQYLVNGKIPPERELCEKLAVSRITVRAAVDDLIDEGILKRNGRRGTTICKVPSSAGPGEKNRQNKKLLFLYFSSIRGHVVEQSGTSSHLYHGIERYANEHGYALMVQSGENFLSNSNYANLDVDGIIAGGTSLEKHIPLLKEAGIPVIVVDSIPHLLDIDAISGDYYEAGARAAEIVIRRKIKNPVFIQLKFDGEAFIQPNLMQRQRGFTDTLERMNQPGEVYVINNRDIDYDGNTVQELLKRIDEDHIGGIIYSADFEYAGLTRHRKISELFSVVIGGSTVLSPSGDNFDQIVFDMDYIGYLAAERLACRIQNPCLKAIRMLIPARQ